MKRGSKMIVSVSDLVKAYSGRNVVDRISFSIEEGEVFGFLGPNAAGKTTSIRMMIGLIKPTSGQVYIDGNDVVKHREKIYRDIGVVFESQNLYSKFSVRDNLKLFSDLFGLTEQRLKKVMDDLQLCDKREVKVEKLSKGWRQRILIARALLHEPRLLFLDEPTSGLDQNTTALIRSQIKEINAKGTTVILTTHDLHEADELSTCVGIMHNGKLAGMGRPDVLKEKHAKNEIVIEYRYNQETKKEKLPMSEDTMKFVARLQKENSVLSLHSREGTLADVFTSLTGGELN